MPDVAEIADDFPDHEWNCPIRAPHPATCCTCGNDKAEKWNGERFHSPHYDGLAVRAYLENSREH